MYIYIYIYIYIIYKPITFPQSTKMVMITQYCVEKWAPHFTVLLAYTAMINTGTA